MPDLDSLGLRSDEAAALVTVASDANRCVRRPTNALSLVHPTALGEDVLNSFCLVILSTFSKTVQKLILTNDDQHLYEL